ncbi:hypothetical protein GTZ99_02935 [Novosphingobium sp. FSY-8]|uniref:Uncharacterized protein n=1 Tax=Novosphingobium ovatum TaxID=1908523 RepID=A0ABW9XAG7_9SPHN|nr:hypothetical protein [Novosphingobium ovatum]NBC35507.1 hypothetical protein [Novosphingobium ovatum]
MARDKVEPPLAANDPRQFQACDGYGAPNENGDGISRIAMGWLGLFVPAAGAGNTTASTPAFSSWGIAACNGALANPRLAPTYHLRRASLLRARAIHRLSAQDNAGALGDLDAADDSAAKAAEPLYARSMGLGSQLLRAYLAMQAGHRDEVLALTAQTRNARPYVYRVQQVSDFLALSATHDADAFYAALDRQATLNPESRRALFQLAIERRDWAKVIATRQQLDFTPPAAQQGGFQIQHFHTLLVQLFSDELEADQAMVFALAATGKDDAAKALLAQIDTRIEALGSELPKRADGSSRPRAERDAHAILGGQQVRFRAQSAVTRRLLDLLVPARAGDNDAFNALLKAGQPTPPLDGRSIFLMETLRDATHGPKAPLSNTINAMRARADIALDKFRLPMDRLYQAMPAPETRERLPKFREAKGLFGDYDGNGFVVTQDGPVTKVSFGGLKAAEATVEELALLKAAELTLAAGHDRFAMLDKRITARTLTHTSIYGSWSMPEGYVADIRILPFDANAVPKGYEAYAERPVIARDVIAALAPIYHPSPAP